MSKQKTVHQTFFAIKIPPPGIAEKRNDFLFFRSYRSASGDIFLRDTNQKRINCNE